MSNIYEKLRNAQVELKAPKNQYNSFGKYKYRNAEDIMEAVKPINQKHGLTLTISDEIAAVGNRVYVKATATLTDGTDIIVNCAYAREEESKKGMDGSQVTGASSSYARKYALNGLYLIDDTKDADTDEQRNEQEARSKKQNVSKQQNLTQEPNEQERIQSVRNSIAKLTKLLIDEYGGSSDQVQKYIEKVTGKPIKEVDYDTALDIIKKLVAMYEAKGK